MYLYNQKKFRYIFPSIVLILSIFFSLLFLELIFGNWFKTNEWLKANNLNIIRNREIVYNTEKITGVKDSTIKYSRNEFGLRDNCKSISDIKIITIGGSTTDQRYIDDSKTFQTLLQKKILKEFNKIYCISNAGIDGHSSFGHLYSFKYWFNLIPNLRPDYFLLYIGINDASLRLKPRIGIEHPEKKKIDSLIYKFKENSAFYSLLRKLKDYWSQNTNGIFAMHSYEVPSLENYNSNKKTISLENLIKENSMYFSERLKKIIYEIKTYGSKPICVSQPHLFVELKNGKKFGFDKVSSFQGKNINGIDFQESLNLINNILKKECVLNGGYFFDIASRKFDKSDFYDLVHMSPKGTQKLADYLFYEMSNYNLINHLN